MKTFDELTDAEVLALTDEQVSRYIDIACAEAGVPLFVQPPEAPAPTPKRVGDVRVHVVAGLYFAERADAERVAAAINSAARFNHTYDGYDYSSRFVVPTDEEIEVTSESLFSRSAWSAVRDAVAQEKKAAEANKAAQKEYERIRNEREDAAEPIRDRIARVCSEQYERERMQSRFNEYVNLAEGDESIARRFLQKAYPNAVEVLPELFVEHAEEVLL